VYRHLKPQTPVPDLVIYLQAPVDVLVERVLRRGVPSERGIPESYLARLADAYTRYFYRYADAALLIVNSERLNFVDNPGHVDLLLERIRHMRGPREFFNLGTA
jgi:deoxyadenosine/deoxycytidine kinase